MKEFNHESVRGTENDLERVVQPLASYICATNRPKAALIQALAFLFREVKQINGVAQVHLATLSENHG
jgi:hypothetical protein